MAESVHFDLGPDELPTAWFNLVPDMVGAGMQPLPPLHPGTREPIGPVDLAPLFPESLIMQEVSTERWIDIPGPVLDVYRLWRPTPLYRARRLEQALQTPARIYFKYEGTSPTGSHKPNTAIAQVYYNKEAGIRRISTETGAGQWGSALAFACQMFGLESLVYMVKASYQQKPYRRVMMETFGATVHASPSDTTQVGKRVLGDTPDSTGSLGIAISEAVEVAAKNADTSYALGSVLNHVLLHQTVIGQEAIAQLELAGEYPDVVVGCVGGGSNFAGVAYPFMRAKLREDRPTRFVAAEPAACPTLTKGVYRYDFGDTVGMTPLMPMYTLGHDFVPPPVHAGGLRYHGDAPSLSALVKEGLVEPVAITQTSAFDAALTFARSEGIIPAPEPSHALRAAFDEAELAKKMGEERVILVNVCGHGHFDMSAYDAYLRGELTDLEFSDEDMEAALERLPDAPVPA